MGRSSCYSHPAISPIFDYAPGYCTAHACVGFSSTLRLSTVQYGKSVNWRTGVKKLLQRRTPLSYGTFRMLQSSGNLTGYFTTLRTSGTVAWVSFAWHERRSRHEEEGNGRRRAPAHASDLRHRPLPRPCALSRR
jgi:hypothetical protein